ATATRSTIPHPSQCPVTSHSPPSPPADTTRVASPPTATPTVGDPAHMVSWATAKRPATRPRSQSRGEPHRLMRKLLTLGGWSYDEATEAGESATRSVDAANDIVPHRRQSVIDPVADAAKANRLTTSTSPMSNCPRISRTVKHPDLPGPWVGGP